MDGSVHERISLARVFREGKGCCRLDDDETHSWRRGTLNRKHWVLLSNKTQCLWSERKADRQRGRQTTIQMDGEVGRWTER